MHRFVVRTAPGADAPPAVLGPPPPPPAGERRSAVLVGAGAADAADLLLGDALERGQRKRKAPLLEPVPSSSSSSPPAASRLRPRRPKPPAPEPAPEPAPAPVPVHPMFVPRSRPPAPAAPAPALPNPSVLSLFTSGTAGQGRPVHSFFAPRAAAPVAAVGSDQAVSAAGLAEAEAEAPGALATHVQQLSPADERWCHSATAGAPPAGLVLALAQAPQADATPASSGLLAPSPEASPALAGQLELPDLDPAGAVPDGGGAGTGGEEQLLDAVMRAYALERARAGSTSAAPHTRAEAAASLALMRRQAAEAGEAAGLELLTETYRPREPEAVWGAAPVLAALRQGEGDSGDEQRALLLVGPVGCGKTALVEALASWGGRRYKEIGPGQARDRASIMRDVHEATQSLAIAELAEAAPSGPPGAGATTALVFEEVDVAFEPADRGFYAALTALAAGSKVPLYFTANDLPRLLARWRPPAAVRICRLAPPESAEVLLRSLLVWMARGAPGTLSGAVAAVAPAARRGDYRQALMQLMLPLPPARAPAPAPAPQRLLVAGQGDDTPVPMPDLIAGAARHAVPSAVRRCAGLARQLSDLDLLRAALGPLAASERRGPCRPPSSRPSAVLQLSEADAAVPFYGAAGPPTAPDLALALAGEWAGALDRAQADPVQWAPNVWPWRAAGHRDLARKLLAPCAQLGPREQTCDLVAAAGQLCRSEEARRAAGAGSGRRRFLHCLQGRLEAREVARLLELSRWTTWLRVDATGQEAEAEAEAETRGSARDTPGRPEGEDEQAHKEPEEAEEEEEGEDGG